MRGNIPEKTYETPDICTMDATSSCKDQKCLVELPLICVANRTNRGRWPGRGNWDRMLFSNESKFNLNFSNESVVFANS